ncbi:MAG: hypothetical protein WCI74_06150 [Actinomycetes bacterium]
MSPVSDNRHDVARYQSLGLFTNPFALADEDRFEGMDFETNAEANRLIAVLSVARAQATAKPIVVDKDTEKPAYYPLRAVSIAEQTIISSESLGVLHAYIPFFMMRLGRVRATLQVVAERLSFRDFEKTLASYVDQVLAEPDDGLVAYQVLGDEGLAAFADRFGEDRDARSWECSAKPT